MLLDMVAYRNRICPDRALMYNPQSDVRRLDVQYYKTLEVGCLFDYGEQGWLLRSH